MYLLACFKAAAHLFARKLAFYFSVRCSVCSRSSEKWEEWQLEYIKLCESKDRQIVYKVQTWAQLLSSFIKGEQ